MSWTISLFDRLVCQRPYHPPEFRSSRIAQWGRLKTVGSSAVMRPGRNARLGVETVTRSDRTARSATKCPRCFIGRPAKSASRPPDEAGFSSRNRSKVWGQVQQASRHTTGPTIFSQQILQRRIVRHGVGQQLFQPSVLGLEATHPLGLRHLEAAILSLPVIERRVAHAVLAAEFSDRHPGLVLLQDPDDRFFREPTALHIRPS